MLNPGMKSNHDYHAVVIGSGFTGSITAMILARRGSRVRIVDPVGHPRMVVGESSTPIADFLLRRLDHHFDVPLLSQWSAWGTWQAHHRDIDAGKKRGFSYYQHRRGQVSATAESMLVAASVDDDSSDTHWMRRDVDQRLFEECLAAGVDHDPGQSVTAVRDHRVVCGSRAYTADWIIDASGAAGVTRRLGDVGQSRDYRSWMRTDTRCRYDHRIGVGSYSDHHRTDEDPFDGDAAAQHHLCDDRGWIWMLRFASGITSVGVVQRRVGGEYQTIAPEDYPSVASVMRDSRSVSERSAGRGWRRIDRVQRWTDAVAGDHVLRMPTTAAVVDPLHSTGIAHGLAGVLRVCRIVLGDGDPAIYRDIVHREVRWIDRLVSTAYGCLGDFQRFSLAVMLYVTAAIACEERLIAGQDDIALFGLHDADLCRAIDRCCVWLSDASLSTDEATSKLLREIEPWNVAGFDGRSSGRYPYAATKS